MWSGRDADHSPPTSAEVRGALPPLPHTPSWSGAQLKHMDNFTFKLYFYLYLYLYLYMDISFSVDISI
jgi:hypothetical protein